MIVTEDEAETKRCQESFGPLVTFPSPRFCIASECMAWRWWDLDEAPPYRGYCGKAGKPLP